MKFRQSFTTQKQSMEVPKQLDMLSSQTNMFHTRVEKEVQSKIRTDDI